MMRRTGKLPVIAAAITGAVLFVVTPAALAGGSVATASRASARPGAHIRLHGTFCSGLGAPVSEGPWFAYLDPRAGPPTLMGSVRVFPNTGISCDWRLVANLTVPDVAPGVYWLRICDIGCTTDVGDLVGAGNFTVLPRSPESAARALQRLRNRSTVSERDRLRLERSLEATARSLEAADGRVDALQSDAARLEAALATERGHRNAWIVAAIAAFGVALVSLGSVLRRRRTRPMVPDTVAEMFADVDPEPDSVGLRR